MKRCGGKRHCRRAILHLDGGEWQAALTWVAGWTKDHGLTAIELGGQGDITGTHVSWQVKKDVLEVPSPIASRGRVWMVKNGGIVSCMDARSGRLLYRNRLGAIGAYYASPILVGNRLYVASGKGVVTVLGTGDELDILARNDLQEPILATPAVVTDHLYVRTTGHLYAFGE